MKKKTQVSVLFLVFGLFFFSCGPSQQEKKDKQQKDSIASIKEREKKGEIIWTDNKNGYFIDQRDQHKYTVIKIGNMSWLAENLAYKPCTGNYWSYDNNQSNVSKYGYLYDWETANRIAPAGWHLPTEKEWKELMKENDISAFNALFSGCRNKRGEFNDANTYAYFWSNTNSIDSYAWYFRFNSQSSEANLDGNRVCGYSVRLLKNN